jgi:hypothetical protein
MRKFGVAILGLLAGVIVGFGLTELIAGIALGANGGMIDGAFPLPLALLLGYLTPVLAIVGVVVALGIDGRSRRDHDAA